MRPARTPGLRTTLLTKILPGDFHGSAALSYPVDGLEYAMTAPWPEEAK